jgi:peptide-methionine (S)-S-oxide reductase
MNKLNFFAKSIIVFLCATGCLSQDEASISINKKNNNIDKKKERVMETSILGGGCFWCTEAVFERVEGIKDVISGYAGGEILNPTYKQICTGTTGHAEVIKIIYDPKVITYEQLLQIFAECHDPTTLNRQGADVGTQYRSTIMYLSDSQEKAARLWKESLSNKFVDPVVTEIIPAPKFYKAEEYHQDYYTKNPNQGYCSVVIRPKLKKLKLE